MTATHMEATDSVRSDSQRRFIGTILFGAVLFALGCSTFLFSVSTPYFVALTDRTIAVLVSVGLLALGGGLIYSRLR